MNVPPSPEMTLKYLRTRNKKFTSLEQIRNAMNKPSKVPLYQDHNFLADTKVKGYWVGKVPSDENRPNHVLLSLHGGAFVAGSSFSCVTIYDFWQREIEEQKLDLVIFTIDYALAPECPFPQGLWDCVNSFLWLKRRFPKVSIAGNSAGGNLTFATLLFLINHNEPLPAKVIGMSAAPSIFPIGMSPKTNADKDWLTFLAPEGGFPSIAKLALFFSYLGDYMIKKGLDPDKVSQDPYASPLYGDFTKALDVPILLQVGGNEMLLDSNVVFAQKLSEQGLNVVLRVYPEMFHDWFCFDTPLTQPALTEVLKFITDEE